MNYVRNSANIRVMSKTISLSNPERQAVDLLLKITLLILFRIKLLAKYRQTKTAYCTKTY